MTQEEERAAWNKFMDESMIVYMLNSLYTTYVNFMWPPEMDEALFWRWFDDVDMQTGAFGK